ncbi:MAG: cell division protein ZapA [Methylococcales bacterium]|nr:MAG: cell division protein ZapA [Methylococcales bacterium]
MSNNPQHVSLMIMGKEYRIACNEEEQDNLIVSAQQLDVQMRKMRDSGKINGPDRIAVMAALNVGHELQLMKNKNIALNQRLNECLSRLTSKIDDALDKN